MEERGICGSIFFDLVFGLKIKTRSKDIIKCN